MTFHEWVIAALMGFVVIECLSFLLVVWFCSRAPYIDEPVDMPEPPPTYTVTWKDGHHWLKYCPVCGHVADKRDKFGRLICCGREVGGNDELPSEGGYDDSRTD